ncbi:MAG: hypothetical protein ACK5NN_06105 [Sphingomonadaceae bacterium]
MLFSFRELSPDKVKAIERDHRSAMDRDICTLAPTERRSVQQPEPDRRDQLDARSGDERAEFYRSNLFAVMAWITIAFRPDRDPQQILLFNDLAWLSFVMTFMFNFVQFICLALAILGDKRDKPIFLRSSAYFGLWVALLLVSGSFAIFFYT